MEEKNTQTVSTGKTKKKMNLVAIIIISIITGLLFIAGIAMVFVMNYNHFSPKPVTITDDSENVYISTVLNDNYQGYRFKFKNDKENIVIETKSNILTIDNLVENGIKIGQTYSITTQYVSENEGNNSKESKPIEWKVYDYLQNPKLTVEEETYIIKWDAVKNADQYKVIISGTSSMVNSFDITDLTVDLKELGIKGDVYDIQVIAYSNYDYFKTSIKSNNITVTYTYIYEALTDMNFYNDTKVLEFSSLYKFENIEIFINGSKHMFKKNPQIVYNEDLQKFVYTIDLSFFIKGDIENIGAKPVVNDQYNIYQNDFVFANMSQTKPE